MSNVYVTQEGKHNYTPALKFGSIEFITHRDFNTLNVTSPSNQEVIERLEGIVDKFNPKKDYILFSGDPVVIAIVFLKIISKHGTINALKYDREQRAYIPFSLDYRAITSSKKYKEFNNEY